MEDYTVKEEIRGHHVYKTTWTPVIGQMLDVQAESHLSLLETAARATHALRACVKSAVTPPFSHIRSISRMSRISSKFLDKKCDLYSGKYGIAH